MAGSILFEIRSSTRDLNLNWKQQNLYSYSEITAHIHILFPVNVAAMMFPNNYFPNKGFLFSILSLPLYLLLFWQTRKVKVWHIIRSAMVPRPLPPWRVQTLQWDLAYRRQRCIPLQCRWSLSTLHRQDLLLRPLSVICRYNSLWNFPIHPCSFLGFCVIVSPLGTLLSTSKRKWSLSKK